MPRAANQYNGSLIRPALCPNSNKAAVLNLEKLIEGRPSICADTVIMIFFSLQNQHFFAMKVNTFLQKKLK